MFTTISTWIVIVAMLFGGGGATALAAQNSLPNDFLYPVKTIGEEMHLSFSPGPQARLELLWRYNERRMEEALKMLAKGRLLDEGWEARWQEQFNQRLQAAAQLDEPAMIRALEQTRLRLRIQEERLLAVQANRPDDPAGTIERLRTRLRQQQRLVDGGLEDPAEFQLRWRERKQGTGQPSETLPPGRQGDGNGPGPGPQITPTCDTCTPALDGTGPGPGPQVTPPCDSCTPALDGTGPQATPPCDTCTPALDGTGPGPGPYGEPECDDCTPALDGTGPGPGPGHQGGGDQPGHHSEGGSDPGESGGSGGDHDNGGSGSGGCQSCGGGGGGGSHRP